MKELKEAVVETAYGGVAGAVFGGIGGMVTGPLTRRSRNSLSRTQVLLSRPVSRGVPKYARLLARDCSVFSAVVLGTTSIMSGIRGKDDLTSRLVSASGGGLAVSFVTQGLKVRPAHALSYAAVYAVLSGAIYKVGETISSRNAQDSF